MIYAGVDYLTEKFGVLSSRLCATDSTAYAVSTGEAGDVSSLYCAAASTATTPTGTAPPPHSPLHQHKTRPQLTPGASFTTIRALESSTIIKDRADDVTFIGSSTGAVPTGSLTTTRKGATSTTNTQVVSGTSAPTTTHVSQETIFMANGTAH